MNQRFKRIRKVIAVFVLIVTAAGFFSCEKYSIIIETADPVVPVLFKTEVQPIFNANCITCHGGAISPDLRDCYNTLKNGGFVNKPGITSRLYVQMTSSSHESRSTAVDKSKVLNWINQGALNN